MAKRYPKEFKLEAVRLSELPDRTAVSVAKELEIKVETLYSWRKKYKKDGNDAFPGQGNLTPELSGDEPDTLT
jgi:transposase